MTNALVPVKKEKDRAFRRLPREETELAKRMKAYFINLPPAERKNMTYEKMSEIFGPAPITIGRYRERFGWDLLALDNDRSIANPFLKQHKDEIKDGDEKLFQIVKARIDRAHKEELVFKDHKDLMNLIDDWLKVSNPQQSTTGTKPVQVSIDKAVVEIRYD